MPNRIVREAILSSERVSSLDWPEEVFYRRLMSVVDDYGRVEANPQLLRARCYPLQTDRVRAADISRWMAACQKSGVILCYADGSKQYLEVLNFQQPQRSASKCPPPPSRASPLRADEINCAQPPTNDSLCVFVSECVSVSESECGKEPRKRATLPGCPDGVAEQVWSDWLALRKAKRAPVNQTVIEAATEEAGKAGMTLDAFLREWCSRGSQGLKAEWLAARGTPGEPQWAKDRKAAVAAYGGAPRQTGEIIDMEAINAPRPKLG